MFETQRVLAKQRSPPTLQRGYVGVVIGGYAVEVAAAGNQLLRNMMLLALVLEQDLEEVGQRPQALRDIDARRQVGSFVFGQRQASGDGLEQ